MCEQRSEYAYFCRRYFYCDTRCNYSNNRKFVYNLYKMSNCTYCGKKGRNNDCVTCDICRKLVHTDCSGLSRMEIECIRSNSRKIHYYCDKCDIVATINKLKSELDVLKSELEVMKNNQGNVARSDNDNLSAEELITEVEERNRRAYNLILFNLSESDEETDVKRNENDTSRAGQTIFSGEHEKIKIMSCCRLGKYNNEKIRPLRISFENPQYATETLRKYIRKEKLYLNRDLTRRQQNQCYMIRTEFKNRREQGEDDIILKYSNGIPKIQKVEKKNS